MSIEDEFMRARANLGNIRTSSSTPNVSPNPAKRGNMSSSDIPPAGFRKMTELEKIGKGIGDIGDAIQGWDPFGIGTFDENWQKTKDNWKTGNGSLGQGLKTLGSFLWSLPTGMASAPFSGLEKFVWEGIGGSPTSEATDEGWIPDYWDEDGGWDEAKQRLASTFDGAIDIVGTFLGGTGRLVKGGARLAKGAKFGEAFTSKTGRETMRELKEKGIQWGSDEYKAASRAITAKAIAGDMAEEGTEEFFQSLAGDIRGTKDKHGLDNESLSRALEAFGLGAAGGLVFSGAADFNRRMGERSEHRQDVKNQEIIDKAVAKALEETPDYKTFADYRQSFDSARDSQYVSQKVAGEFQEKMADKIAMKNGVASSFTLTAPGIGKLGLTEANVSFDELAAGIVSGHDISDPDVATVLPNMSQVAQNFHFTPEELMNFVSLYRDPERHADAVKFLQDKINAEKAAGRSIKIVVEKSPAFNEGPFELEINTVLDGSNQMQINPIIAKRLNSDHDGDKVTAYYGQSDVRRLAAAGASAATGNFRTGKYTEWGGISRATFYGNRVTEGSSAVNAIVDLTRTGFEMLQREGAIPQEITWAQVQMVIESQFDEIRTQLLDQNADFDTVFGNALQRIADGVNEIVATSLAGGTEEEIVTNRYRARDVSNQLVSLIVTISNEQERKRAAVLSYLQAVTGNTLQYTQDQLSSMSVDDVVSAIRDGDDQSINYIRQRISRDEILGVNVSKNQEISNADALAVFMLSAWFDAKIDPSLRNANPIFRANGHWMMEFMGNGQVETGQSQSFFRNWLIAIGLESMKQSDRAQNAELVAKSYVQNLLFNRLRGRKISNDDSFKDFKEQFIKEQNEIADVFSETVETYTRDNAIVLPSIIEASKPKHVDDSDWNSAFLSVYRDVEISQIFDEYNGEYANWTLWRFLERAANKRDGLQVIRELSEDINSGNNGEITKFLESLRNIYIKREVNAEKKLLERLKPKQGKQAIFSKSPSLLRELDDQSTTEERRNQILFTLEPDLVAMDEIFGIDVMQAWGIFSTSQMVKSPLYRSLVRSANQSEMSMLNTIFVGNVYARLQYLFPESDDPANGGFFQQISSRDRTAEQKTESFRMMTQYLRNQAPISEVYTEIFFMARALLNAVEGGNATIEMAASSFMKYMNRVLDFEVTIEDKEQDGKHSLYFEGIYQPTEDGRTSSKDKLRSITIESMADHRTRIDDLGISQRLERAYQSNLSQKLTEQDLRLGAWNEFFALKEDENGNSRAQFIRNRLRASVAALSKSFAANILIEGGSVPSRDMAEKVKTTDAQAQLWSALRIANAPVFRTAFDNLFSNIAGTNYDINDVVNNPQLLSRIIAEPSVEFDVTDEHGFPKLCTGKAVWSILIGEEFTKDDPDLNDYNKLFTRHPELLDLLLDKEVVGAKSGQMSIAQTAIAKGADIIGDKNLVSRYRDSFTDNLEINQLKRRVERTLLSNKSFLSSLPYMIGDDKFNISDVEKFTKTVSDTVDKMVDVFLYSVAQRNRAVNGSAISDPNGYIENLGLRSLFDSVRQQVFETEAQNIYEDIQNFSTTVTDPVTALQSQVAATGHAAYRQAIANLIASVEEARHPADSQEELASVTSMINTLAGTATEAYDTLADTLAGSYNISLDGIDSVLEIPSLINESMPREARRDSTVNALGMTPFSVEEFAEWGIGDDNTRQNLVNMANTSNVQEDVESILARRLDADLTAIVNAVSASNDIATQIERERTRRNPNPETIEGLVQQRQTIIREAQDLIDRHLPRYRRGGSYARTMWDSIAGYSQQQIESGEMRRDLAGRILESSIADAKRHPSLRGRNTQFALSVVNFVEGIHSAWDDVVAELAGENLTPFGFRPTTIDFGKNGFSSERIALVSNRVNDLITGSDVSARTGMEGEQFKTFFAIACLPDYVQDRPHSTSDCSTPPVEMKPADFFTDDNSDALHGGFFRVEGSDHALTYEELLDLLHITEEQYRAFRRGVRNNTADSLPETRNENEYEAFTTWLQEEAGQIQLPPIHDSRYCGCGICGNHPGNRMKRALFSSSAYASEDMTIRARKFVSFCSSAIIKTIGESTVSFEGPTGARTTNPRFLLQPNERMGVDEIGDFYKAYNRRNVDVLAENIKSQIANDSQLRTGWADFSRQRWSFANLMTNFVTITGVNADGQFVSYLYTKDEVLSGEASRDLNARGVASVTQIQQHFQSLDQVSRRILFGMDDRRKRQQNQQLWNGTDTDKALLLQQWAVDSLKNAADMRERTTDEYFSDEIRNAIAKRPSISSSGEIISSFNNAAFAKLINAGAMTANDMKNIDVIKTYTPIQPGFAGHLHNLSNVFGSNIPTEFQRLMFASNQETAMKAKSALPADWNDSFDDYNNAATALQRNLLTQTFFQERSDYSTSLTETSAMPSSGNIGIWVSDNDVVDADLIEKILSSCNGDIVFFGSMKRINQLRNELMNRCWRDAIEMPGNRSGSQLNVLVIDRSNAYNAIKARRLAIPAAPAAQMVWADAFDSTRDQYWMLDNFADANEFNNIPNLFGGLADSTALLFSNSEAEIGAVWRDPINMDLPSAFEGGTICTPSDFALERDRDAIVDSMWENYIRNNPGKKSDESDAKAEFRRFLARTTIDRTTINNNYTVAAVIRTTDAHGATQYYPVIPKAKSGVLVGATVFLPTKVPNKNAVSLIPVEDFMVSAADGNSVKLYSASLIYKAMTSTDSGLGEGWFMLGDNAYALKAIAQKAALDTRLIGSWSDSVIATTMWHLYQKYAIRKAVSEQRNITLGDALEARLSEEQRLMYAEDLNQLKALTSNINWAPLKQNNLIYDLLAGRATLLNDDSGHVRIVLQKLLDNCLYNQINPCILFNFASDSKDKLARERQLQGNDSAIFAGLNADDVHALFNMLDQDSNFCPADSQSLGGPNNSRYYVVRGGEVLCRVDVAIGDENGSKNMITVPVRRRVFVANALSNNTATALATTSNSIHESFVKDISMAMRYGIRNSSRIDDLMNWAISEKGGVNDTWLNTWIASEEGIVDTQHDMARASELRGTDSLEYSCSGLEMEASRAAIRWQYSAFGEEMKNALPLELDGLDAEQALEAKIRAANKIKSNRTGHFSIPLYHLDNLVRAISGTSSAPNGEGRMTADEYNRCVDAAVDALRSGRNPFDARGHEYTVGGKSRFSTGIAQPSTIKWFVKNTDWHADDFAGAVQECVATATEIKEQVLSRITAKDSALLSKAKAVESRINNLLFMNGENPDEIMLYGIVPFSEVTRESFQYLEHLNGRFDDSQYQEDWRRFDKMLEKTRGAIAAQQRRSRTVGTTTADNAALGPGRTSTWSSYHQNKESWQFLKTAATLTRMNSLLNLELPVNASLDKTANYGIQLIATRMADSDNRLLKWLSPYDSSNPFEIDNTTIRNAAHDPQLNVLLNGLREALVNNMLPQFLQYIEQSNGIYSLSEWNDFVEKNMQGGPVSKLINRGFRKVARFATAEGVATGWRNEVFIRRLISLIGKVDSPLLTARVPGTNHTQFEAELLKNPATFIASMFKETSPFYMEARRAFNGALKGDMAQDTLISAFWNAVANGPGPLDFLMATLGCKFVRASTAFTHRVLNSIAPMSAIHYLATQWAIGRGDKWGKRFKRFQGFEYEAEAVQMYSSLKEAIAVDMAHMSMTAVAAILVCTAGGIEPPEDPDKWRNADEWTIFGHRISLNWWLKDILGLTIPLAITWKSAMLGRPQLDTLTASIVDVVSGNPFIRMSDVISAVIDPFAESEEFENAVDLYADYPGGAPNRMEYILGSKKAFGLSYFGQFITPSVIKELTRTLPQYEHSYNLIYADDLYGGDLTEPRRTMKTTFEDAQIRKVTRGNALLGLIMDVLPNDSNTGYGVWEMPIQTILDPYQFKFMDSFSVVGSDGGMKSDAEVMATCCEIVTMLAQTDDMRDLYERGFYLDYTTKKYVSDLLSDLKLYAKQQFQTTNDETNSLDPYVLGFGSELLGKKTAKEIVDSYNEFIALIDGCYQKLWSDDLNQGLRYYNRYNTTWAQDAKGNVYATGFKEGLGAIFMPWLTAPTGGTVTGREGDWATLSAVTGTGMYDEVGNAMRALIPKTLKDYGKKDEDGNVTYSDLYKLLWGKNGLGYGNSTSGGKSGGGYSRGGYTQAPKIYNPSIPGTRYMDGPGRVGSTFRPISNVDLDAFYIRPGFETKGSRKAYRREDI